jgi:hypothetical protein
MKFDLKAPCRECPFRTDVRPYLRPGRVREILDAIIGRQQTFACHKTVDYSGAEDGESDGVVGDNSQNCAGALILLEKIERPNQMMRIAERLGFYDRRKLKMKSSVYQSPEQMIAAYSGSKFKEKSDDPDHIAL